MTRGAPVRRELHGGNMGFDYFEAQPGDTNGDDGIWYPRRFAVAIEACAQTLHDLTGGESDELDELYAAEAEIAFSGDSPV